MSQSIESRFLQFCDWLKDTRRLRNDKELSSTLGISPSMLSMARNGKRGFSVETLAGVAFNHPQLNTYWVLTGVGSMLDGKKVLTMTARGIEEYVPTPYDPYLVLNREADEETYDRLRGAHHTTTLDQSAQENLMLKREVEKWKDKYIDCLEKSSQQQPK
ncbi:MAG: XRE family transcriptional regulator [Sphingobacteriales bacterium]|nr:MAG: XRE family transcriptional regulator [Sphingobacteriales bacterium]